MANPVNIFDFAGEDLATFLAKLVSDGNYGDVFGTLKQDMPTQEATATDIYQYGGQLFSNGVDDFIQASYPYIRQIAIGGAAGRWDESLANGPNSNGEDRYTTEGDHHTYSEVAGPLADATIAPVYPGAPPTSQADPNFDGEFVMVGTQPAAGGGAWHDVGTIYTLGTPAANVDAQIMLEWRGARKATTGTAASSMGKLEEIWEFNGASWSLLRSDTVWPEISGVFRFLNAGSGAIKLQCADMNGPASRARGVIRFQVIEGRSGI